ncbi:MAG: AAA family ATPase, partial [Oscillospiraceae bacterium]|nr:AAA family ATPase [Oscillospiraceae bacterium]
MMCSRCKKRPAVMFVSTMSSTERKSEGLCLQCAKELGLPQVSEYLKQMGISEDELESACDSIFGENGELDSDFLKQLGLDGKDDDDDAMDENFPDSDEEDVPGEEDNLFERGGAGTMPNFLKNLFGGGSSDNSNNDAETEKKPKKKQEKIDKKRKCLETYCTNLTRRAKEGKIDRIIGREKEIYRVLQILSRRTKNNPCLIGEPGVGKTAIAEGIALKLASGDVPFRLRGKELYLLDLTALVAGTQFRGQFESRVKSLIDEVKNAGNVMLFVDEVHNLVGTGGDSEGSMNAANIFKPALSRGELQVIGATTFSEYRKHIEK